MSIEASRKLDLFFLQFKQSYYKKGEVILRADEVPPGVFYLRTGYVRDYTLSKDAEELCLIIYKPGDIFPIPWVIINKPHEHYLEAMTRVEIWYSPKEQFLQFIKTNPKVLFELTSRISTRLSGLLDRMKYLVFGNAYAKVCSILLICGERFGRTSGNSTIIQVPLTHKDIATLVGLTRETTSRQIIKLFKKKILSQKNHLIVIENPKKLVRETLASSENP